MTRLLPSAALAVLLALSLVGCEGVPEGDVPDARKYGRFGPGTEYVALGDSYTAAPHTGPADGDDGCLRSTTNYPHLVAEATGTSLTDVSCSGADSRALTTPQETPFDEVPAQLAAVSRDTDLVTVGVGGNDDRVYSKLVAACPQLTANAPTGCEELATDGRGVDGMVRDIRRSVVKALARIQEKAPDALVLVVGYPQIFPTGKQGCDDLPMSGPGLRAARRVFAGFSTALEEAAETANVRYVDVAAASRGHDICGAHPWAAGAPVRRSGAAAYHPYAVGAEQISRLVLAELD